MTTRTEAPMTTAPEAPKFELHLMPTVEQRNEDLGFIPEEINEDPRIVEAVAVLKDAFRAVTNHEIGETTELQLNRSLANAAEHVADTTVQTTRIELPACIEAKIEMDEGAKLTSLLHIDENGMVQQAVQVTEMDNGMRNTVIINNVPYSQISQTNRLDPNHTVITKEQYDERVQDALSRA